MSRILLDTHVWAWNMTAPQRLSATALRAIDEASTVMVSPITFFEIALKVRLGKWPEMEQIVVGLADVLADQGGMVAPLDPILCGNAGGMRWPHRDPFDRLLAATALHYGLDLVSANGAFDGIVKRIW